MGLTSSHVLGDDKTRHVGCSIYCMRRSIGLISASQSGCLSKNKRQEIWRLTIFDNRNKLSKAVPRFFPSKCAS